MSSTRPTAWCVSTPKGAWIRRTHPARRSHLRHLLKTPRGLPLRNASKCGNCCLANPHRPTRRVPGPGAKSRCDPAVRHARRAGSPRASLRTGGHVAQHARDKKASAPHAVGNDSPNRRANQNPGSVCTAEHSEMPCDLSGTCARHPGSEPLWQQRHQPAIADRYNEDCHREPDQSAARATHCDRYHLSNPNTAAMPTKA